MATDPISTASDLCSTLVERGVLPLQWSATPDAALATHLGSVMGDQPSLGSADDAGTSTRVRIVTFIASAHYVSDRGAFVAALGTGPHLMRDTPTHHEAAMRTAKARGDEPNDVYCARTASHIQTTSCQCRALIESVFVENTSVASEFIEKPAATDDKQKVPMDEETRRGYASLAGLERATLLHVASHGIQFVRALDAEVRVCMRRDGSAPGAAEFPCAYLRKAWGGVIHSRRVTGATTHAHDARTSSSLDPLPCRTVFVPFTCADRVPVFRVPYSIDRALQDMWLLRPDPSQSPLAQLLADHNRGLTALTDANTLARTQRYKATARRLVLLAAIGEAQGRRFNAAAAVGIQETELKAAMEIVKFAPTGESDASVRQSLALTTDTAHVVRAACDLRGTLYPMWNPADALEIEWRVSPADAPAVADLAVVCAKTLGIPRLRIVVRATVRVTVRFVHCAPCQ